MNDLDLVISPPKHEAPLALGGSLSGDHYTIASEMVAVVLKSLGWRVQRIGPNLPFDSMLNSIRDRKPRLFWLSVSCINDSDEFVSQYKRFIDSLDSSTTVVLGGQAFTPDIREQHAFSGFCENMGKLVEFVGAITPTPASS
jgi:methanogenic corrinoid protein MtbC1